MKPALSIMIRTGSSSTGVTTILNDFHSTVASTGFFTNAVGGGSGGEVTPPPTPPPEPGAPYFWGCQAKDLSDAFTIGQTLFVSPHGFLEDPPRSVEKLYLSMEFPSRRYIKLSWSNAYSGTLNSKILSNRAQVVPTTAGPTFIRLDNRSVPYRMFVNTGQAASVSGRAATSADAELEVVVLGPVSIAKLQAWSDGSFNLSQIIRKGECYYSARLERYVLIGNAYEYQDVSFSVRPPPTTPPDNLWSNIKFREVSLNGTNGAQDIGRLYIYFLP